MGLDVTAERERLKAEGEAQAEKLKREAEARRQQQIKAEEEERNRRAEELNRTLKSERKAETPRLGYQVDCHACKLEGGMVPAKIKRFTGMVHLTGSILTFPSILGMAAAVLCLFAPGSINWWQKIGAAITIFCISAVLGLVGWLLTSKRPVFLCKRCGYVMDRTTE